MVCIPGMLCLKGMLMVCIPGMLCMKGLDLFIYYAIPATTAAMTEDPLISSSLFGLPLATLISKPLIAQQMQIFVYLACSAWKEC